MPAQQQTGTTESHAEQAIVASGNWYRWSGQVCQAVVLGEVLFFAFWVLYSVQAGARVFRYAGF